MCNRRSMGCVYYRCQLVFADIINNKTESYIDIVDWTWYIHVMIDTWHLIVYLTWHILYCVLSTLLFIYFMYVTSHPVYFYSSIVVICTHCLCTCTFPFYFTHSLSRCLMTLNLHVQIRCFILLFKCSMRPYMLRAGVSLLGRPFSVLCYSPLFMSFLLIFYTGLLFYSYIPLLSLC